MKSEMTRRSMFAALLAPVVAPVVAALAPVHKETLACKWAKQIEIQRLFDPRYYGVITIEQCEPLGSFNVALGSELLVPHDIGVD